MRFIIKILILFVLCSNNSFASQYVLGTAHYLGNEGVMIVGEQKKILFDPLFDKNYKRFTLVPEKLKLKMLGNIEPFKNIDAIFISHSHADHFDANELSSYLHKYQNVQLIAPKQAIDKLKLLPDHKKITKQLHEISMEVGEKPIEIFFDGFQIEVLRIPHVGLPDRADVENLVYRVTLDNFTVMHLGDSDIDPEHYLPLSNFWSKKATHHAFIPGVFSVDANSELSIKELLNVKRITHIHIPMNVPDNLKELKVDFFSIPDEIREIIDTGSSELKSVAN